MKLVEAASDTFHRDRSAVWLNLVPASFVVIKSWWAAEWFLLSVGFDRDSGGKQSQT